MNLPKFFSFKAGVIRPCPKPFVPKVIAYSFKGCVGTPVDAGKLPLNSLDGDCKEILAGVAGQQGLVSVGGESAIFQCED